MEGEAEGDVQRARCVHYYSLCVHEGGVVAGITV